MKNLFILTLSLITVIPPAFGQIGYTKKYAGVWYDDDAIAFINIELNIGIEHASATIDWELHFKDGVKENFSSQHSSYHYSEYSTGYFSRDKKTGKLEVPKRLTSGYRVRQFNLWDLTFSLSEDEKLLTGYFNQGSVRCGQVKQKIKSKKGWSGEWKDGKKTGFGYYLYTNANEKNPRQSEQYIYIGEFQNDLLQGNGIFITNAQEKLKIIYGNFKDNQVEGPGHLYVGGCPNYDDEVLYYTGNFINSKLEGKVFGFNCDNQLVSECNASNGNLNCKLLVVDHRTKKLAELFALGTLTAAGGAILFKAATTLGVSGGTGSGGMGSGDLQEKSDEPYEIVYKSNYTDAKIEEFKRTEFSATIIHIITKGNQNNDGTDYYSNVLTYNSNGKILKQEYINDPIKDNSIDIYANFENGEYLEVNVYYGTKEPKLFGKPEYQGVGAKMILKEKGEYRINVLKK